MAPQAPSQLDLAPQLAQLAELYKDGVLSDEEFATAKAQVLGGPPQSS